MSAGGYSTPPFFKREPAPLVRLVLFLLFALILLVIDLRFRYLDVLRQVLSVLTYPVQVAAAKPAELARNASVYFSTLVEVQRENARLRRAELDAAQRLLLFGEIERENTRLRALLNMSERLEQISIAANILYNARDPYTRKVILDRGSHHEVEAGQAVLDETGMIGQITRVYPIQAEVTLVTDRSAAVPVKIDRNGLPGVVYGRGDGMLELRFQLSRVDVEPNDRLVTSGLDGVFPPGLPVATVISVERDARAFAHILAKPDATVDYIGQVLVLGRKEPPPPIPQDGLTPPPSARKKPLPNPFSEPKAEATQ
jgi:rod shape-determining protein MreC